MSDTAERLAELQVAVVEAQQAERELSAEAQAAQAQAKALEQQLAALPADQFDETGKPLAKTEAAKLAAELAGFKHPPVSWQQRTAAASNRVATAKRAVVRHRARHGEQLIMDREHEAIAIRDALLTKVEDLKDAARAYSRFHTETGNLLNGITGLDHADMPNATSVDQLLRTLNRFSGDVPIPLPRSMYPQEGQQQPRVRTDSGWISKANWESSQEQERQAARDQERGAQRAARSEAGRLEPVVHPLLDR
jgi:hypothetical protein